MVTFYLLSGRGPQPAPLIPTVDETKIALEVEATAMRNFLTFQAATVWPSAQPAPATPLPTPLSSVPAGGTTALLSNENEGYALRYPSE